MGEVKGDKYRDHIYGEGEANTVWKHGAPPNYDAVNKLFEEERTHVWEKGSLEDRVQRLLKTFEMELVHKARIQDYKSIDPDSFTFSLNESIVEMFITAATGTEQKLPLCITRNPALPVPIQAFEISYRVCAIWYASFAHLAWFGYIGRDPLNFKKLREIGGSYNFFLQTSLPDELKIYDPKKETEESSKKAFGTTFSGGFAIEILHVYSGPPNIVYKFRHWAYMEGPFLGHAPTGKKVELYGMAHFEVDDTWKIKKVEFFFDRGELLSGLVEGPLLKGSKTEAGFYSVGCPMMKQI